MVAIEKDQMLYGLDIKYIAEKRMWAFSCISLHLDRKCLLIIISVLVVHISNTTMEFCFLIDSVYMQSRNTTQITTLTSLFIWLHMLSVTCIINLSQHFLYTALCSSIPFPSYTEWTPFFNPAWGTVRNCDCWRLLRNPRLKMPRIKPDLTKYRPCSPVILVTSGVLIVSAGAAFQASLWFEWAQVEVNADQFSDRTLRCH